MLYFYVSYAGGEDDTYIQMFFADLCAEVRAFAGLPPDTEVGFLDTRTLHIGERWSDEITNALATAQVFVALCSPRYFLSDACGREWALFDRRQSKSGAPGRPNAIVPLNWLPSRVVPRAAQGIQWVYNGDTGQSVRQLLRLAKNRDDYLDFITLLAETILERAERTPLRPGLDLDLGSVSSAFDPSPAIASGTDTDQDVASVVRAAFASAGRRMEPNVVPNEPFRATLGSLGVVGFRRIG
jgi:hypothetical protein